MNKCESIEIGASQASEFWKLGLGEPIPISAIHGSGTGDLLDLAIDQLPEIDKDYNEDEINMSIIGRPNVGKSSLLNAFCGEQRSIVSPIRGTTRDTIDISLKRENKSWRIIDTAGIRRKKSVNYGPEFFGINRSFKSIDRSDVCLLVIDAEDGVTEQDQKLAGRIEQQGRACVVVINKWDLINKDEKTIYKFEKEFRSKLFFLEWATLIFVSAKTKKRVESIFKVALSASEQHSRRVSTSVVNEVLREAVSWRSPPTSRGGKQGRIYYGTQVTSKPPTFLLFVNDPKLFGSSYKRYFERQMRENLGFDGTPIFILWRGKQEKDVAREIEKKLLDKD